MPVPKRDSFKSKQLVYWAKNKEKQNAIRRERRRCLRLGISDAHTRKIKQADHKKSRQLMVKQWKWWVYY